jgi:hypothetical protein
VGAAHRLHGVILLASLGVSWGLLVLLDPARIARLAREDGPYEWVGALALLGASALLLGAFFRRREGNDLLLFRTPRNVLLLGLGLLFFVGFGEEISWGQRVLGVHSPAVFSEHNRQGEINIHNLDVFHGRDQAGARKSGAAAWLNIDRLFTLFCVTWLFALPTAARASPWAAGWLRRLNVPLPPPWVGVVFLANYAVSKILESGAGRAMAHYVVEVKECNAALVVLAAAVLIASAAGTASATTAQAAEPPAGRRHDRIA